MKFEEALTKLSTEARTKLDNCQNIEDIIRIFDENGLEVTKSDIEAAIKSYSSELSDDDLAVVTGGIDASYWIQQGIKGLVNLAKDWLSNKDEKGK